MDSYPDDARSNTLGPYCDDILAISDWDGVGICWRIRSNWLNVDVPWNNGLPSKISPRIQPWKEKLFRKILSQI